MENINDVRMGAKRSSSKTWALWGCVRWRKRRITRQDLAQVSGQRAPRPRLPEQSGPESSEATGNRWKRAGDFVFAHWLAVCTTNGHERPTQDPVAKNRLTVSRILDLDRHNEPYVSVAELARYWGVSDDMIRRDIEKGALKVMVVGSSRIIRIPLAEARRYGRPRTKTG